MLQQEGRLGTMSTKTMTNPQDTDIPPESQSPKDIVNAYQDALEKSRNQRESCTKTVYEESQRNIRNHFKKIKSELKDTLDSWENMYLTQYYQLAEIREIVEIERRSLEELYQVKLPPDSLVAIASLKREKRQNLEQELTQKKREFDLEMEEKRRTVEHQLGLSIQTLTRHLDMKQAELKKVEAEIASRIQTKEMDIQLKEKEITLNYQQKIQKLEAELTHITEQLDSESQSLVQKRAERQSELEHARNKIEDMFSSKQKEFDVEIDTKKQALNKLSEELSQKSSFLDKQQETIEQKGIALAEKEIKLTLERESLDKKYTQLENDQKKLADQIDHATKEAAYKTKMDYEDQLTDMAQQIKKNTFQKNQEIQTLKAQISYLKTRQTEEKDYKLMVGNTPQDGLKIVRPMKGR